MVCERPRPRYSAQMENGVFSVPGEKHNHLSDHAKIGLMDWVI